MGLPSGAVSSTDRAGQTRIPPAPAKQFNKTVAAQQNGAGSGAPGSASEVQGTPINSAPLPPAQSFADQQSDIDAIATASPAAAQAMRDELVTDAENRIAEIDIQLQTMPTGSFSGYARLDLQAERDELSALLPKETPSIAAPAETATDPESRYARWQDPINLVADLNSTDISELSDTDRLVLAQISEENEGLGNIIQQNLAAEIAGAESIDDLGQDLGTQHLINQHIAGVPSGLQTDAQRAASEQIQALVDQKLDDLLDSHLDGRRGDDEADAALTAFESDVEDLINNQPALANDAIIGADRLLDSSGDRITEVRRADDPWYAQVNHTVTGWARSGADGLGDGIRLAGDAAGDALSTSIRIVGTGVEAGLPYAGDIASAQVDLAGDALSGGLRIVGNRDVRDTVSVLSPVPLPLSGNDPLSNAINDRIDRAAGNLADQIDVGSDSLASEIDRVTEDYAGTVGEGFDVAAEIVDLGVVASSELGAVIVEDGVGGLVTDPVGTAGDIVRGANNTRERIDNFIEDARDNGISSAAKELGLQAVEDFGDDILSSDRIGDAIGDVAFEGVEAGLEYQRAIGEPVTERPLRDVLTEEQQRDLEDLFGENLDLDSVVFVTDPGILAGKDDRPYVVGNYIFLGDLDPGNPDDWPVIKHELTHVWQGQNGGLNYIPDALYAQEFGEGYNVARPFVGGETARWEQLNPEQQAELVQITESTGFADAPGQRLLVRPNDPNGRGGDGRTSGFESIAVDQTDAGELDRLQRDGWIDITATALDGLEQLRA